MKALRTASHNKRSRRAVKAYEPVLYALLPILLATAGVLPTLAAVMLIFALPILFLLYRRLGAYMPLFCIAAYGALSLTLNYDLLSVIFLFALFFAFCGLVVAVQFSPYLLCATIAAVCAVLGALGGIGAVLLVERQPLEAVAEQYVYSAYDDPIIGYFARDYYENKKLPNGTDRVYPDRDGYDEAVARRYAKYRADDFCAYYFYDCVDFGGLLAAVAYVFAVLLCRSTAGKFDAEVDTDKLGRSVRCMGGIGKAPCALKDMRLPRAFLWTMALPATVAGIILKFVGDYGVLTATFMHAFVTLPGAFAGFCLLAYFASLFKGKAGVAAKVVLCIIGVAAVAMPVLLFVVAVLGVCDSLLNLRFWTEFIKKL